MEHLSIFKANTQLIEKYGLRKAYIIWTMGLYLDESNLDELASECLIETNADKKIDFIKYDVNQKKIVFAQAYYSDSPRLKDEAPANKASDLNTAAAWLVSGELSDVPEELREIMSECRVAMAAGEVERIELIYTHNLNESVNVSKELETVKRYLSASAMVKDNNIDVSAKELGLRDTAQLYKDTSSQIAVAEDIECPAKIGFENKTDKWQSAILTIPATWLREQFKTHGDKLFSANYRGFLGISRRGKKNINLNIRNTAEKQPDNFWVYNNGITILTHKYTSNGEKTTLKGISIINGAQTTGSVSSLDAALDISKVFVIARVIQCSDPTIVEEIIKYNNTQNEITSWDKYSNDPLQTVIKESFKTLGHEYNLKRGFSSGITKIGIENVIQPVAALSGNFREANRGKDGLFLNDDMYRKIFKDTKVRHILFTFCIAEAIDAIRLDLKEKSANNLLPKIEGKMHSLLKNLRFKYFFMALFGKTLEVILDENLTHIKDVCFTSLASNGKLTNVEVLTASVIDVVKMVLAQAAVIIADPQLTFDSEDYLTEVADKISTNFYTLMIPTAPPAITQFRKIVKNQAITS